MLNYPLSYIVYITTSFILSILSYFVFPSFNFNIIALLVMVFVFASLFTISKQIKYNTNLLSLLFIVVSIFFLSYLYTDCRYKNIKTEIKYENEIDAFTCRVIGYDGDFPNERNKKRSRYICEVYSIHYKENTLSNFEDVYFRIRLYNTANKEIKINDRLLVNSKINFYKNILTNENSDYDNEAMLNALNNKKLIGVSSVYRNERFTIEERKFSFINILNKYSKEIRKNIRLSLTHISDKNKSVILSIVLGDKTELTNDTRLLFSNVGLLHILAVSGLHISIVVLIFNCFLFFIVKKEITRMNIAIILSVIIFPAVTLFSVSVLRASIMYLLVFISSNRGGKINSLHNLFLTALIILVFNPIAIFDMSFQFSFLATLGIITYYSAYNDIVKNKNLYKFMDFIIITISAIIIITPLSIYYFGILNLNSIISNLYANFYAFIIIMLTFVNSIIYNIFPKLFIYSSYILDKITGSFIFIASKQEGLNILKYNININMYLALILTLILSIVGIVIKYKTEKKRFNSLL